MYMYISSKGSCSIHKINTNSNIPMANSKIKIKVNVQGKLTEREVHRVQMLDPATGTGTYLAEVIKKKYHRGIGIRKARTANSTYQQLAVQWFIENLC